jgi:hypothetical protein
MKTLQLKTNINCSNCVAKVTPLLDAATDIASWQVDTANADKILTAEGQNLSAGRIAEILAPSGFKVLGEVVPAPKVDEHHNHHLHTPGMDMSKMDMSSMNIIPEEEYNRSFLETYKPLFLVLGYILGGVILREWVAGPGGRWDAHLMMQNFMGGFFIAFSFFKMLDIPGFASSYRMYDLIAERVPGYGNIYPFIELILGVLYLAGAFPVATNAITLVLMLVGLAGVWNSLRQKRAIRCACLGTGFNLPMSTVTLIEDGGMAAMAAVMLIL